MGLNVGDMLGHVPLPAKITIDVLEPIDLREEFGEEPDLDEVYTEVLGPHAGGAHGAPGGAPAAGARLMRVERTRTIDAPRERDLGARARSRPPTRSSWTASRAASRRGEPIPWTATGLPRRHEPGLGSRFSMRMHVGSAEVGGLVEVVEFDEPGDLSWTNVTGIDQRGRWRLRETSDGRTRVTLRLSYEAPGGVLGMISDRVSRADGRRATSSGRSRTCNVSSKEERRKWRSQGRALTGRIGYALGSAKVLVDAGVIRPIRPDKLRQGAHHAGPLRAQPGRGNDLAGRPLPGRDDDRRRARHAHVRRGPPAHQRARPRAVRRRASRRATAWGSCAATTAASSSRPWPCRSSARTPSTSTPRSPDRS